MNTNVIASGALECSNVKAGRAGGDPCQHCYRFALWAWWPVKRAHDAVPCIRREHYALSHRIDARDGPVMELASTLAARLTDQYCSLRKS
jgi:hypothetical protein